MTVAGLFDRVQNIKPGATKRVVCVAVVALTAANLVPLDPVEI